MLLSSRDGSTALWVDPSVAFDGAPRSETTPLGILQRTEGGRSPWMITGEVALPSEPVRPREKRAWMGVNGAKLTFRFLSFPPFFSQKAPPHTHHPLSPSPQKTHQQHPPRSALCDPGGAHAEFGAGCLGGGGEGEDGVWVGGQGKKEGFVGGGGEERG